MTQTNNLPTQPINLASLIKPMLLGAGTGLLLISIFLFSVRYPHPEWGKFWMVRPLIIVPLAGAGGGLFFYFIDYLLGHHGGWLKGIAVMLGVVGFVIALWLGTVLGLSGTLWH